MQIYKLITYLNLFLFVFQVRSTGSPLSPLLYGDPLGSPPPAHMGGLPYSLDPSRGLLNLSLVYN